MRPILPQIRDAAPRVCRHYGRYYDFLVRYEELLIAPDMKDWNIDREDRYVTLAGAAVSMLAEPGTVWAVLRRSPLFRIVHLVNLADQDSITWNALRTPPGTIADREVKVAGLPTLKQVLVLTPDEPRAVSPAWSQEGDVVRLRLPQLNVWTTLLCVLENEEKVGPEPLQSGQCSCHSNGPMTH